MSTGVQHLPAATAPAPRAIAPSPKAPDRLGGLRRFAIAISVLNIIGHWFLGFEPSILHPIAALAAAYATEILLDRIDSSANGRAPKFAGGVRSRVDFLLSAHISGLAVAMLLYSGDRVWPVVFAAVVAIASKALFRVGEAKRHFLNPSNFGITVTLLLFPWVSAAPAYQFTENLDRIGDWLLPALIVCTGSLLNLKFTRRWPLISAWLVGFLAQAVLRSLMFGTPLIAGLVPMTGLAFLLFTFYMITDPGTTPTEPREQVAFGLSVALVYGVLTAAHIVFGIFFALTIVCFVRGGLRYLQERSAVPGSVAAGELKVPVVAIRR